MCSIVVAYARPFTKSQITSDIRLIPLKDVHPPSKLASTHRMVLELRDKVFGHKDAVPSKAHTTTPNIVLIRRMPSDFQFHAVIVDEILPSLLLEIKELCSFFVTHCESRLAPFIDRYRAEIMQHPEGFYELVIGEPRQQWLRRHDKPLGDS